MNRRRRENAADPPEEATEVSRADLEDGAELAVLTATRSKTELAVGVMLLVVAFVAFLQAALTLGHAAGYALMGVTTAAYGAAAIRVQNGLSPTAPDAEVARRLASDIVVTSDGEYKLTTAGRRKVQAYRAQRAR